MAKTNQDQHFKFSPQRHVLVYKLFFDNKDNKHPRQISVAETLKPFRQSSFFSSLPPIFFQNLGLKVAPPAERGEEDTVNTIARPKIDSYHLHRLRTRERLKLIPGVQNVRYLINIRENYFQLNFLMITFS